MEAVAGDDLKILVAQLTTAGEISGQVQCQIFLGGVNENEFREVLPIGFACNDPAAANYNPEAYNADGCVYPDGLNELTASFDLQMHPNPAKDVVTVTLPESIEATWIGADLQARSTNGQLVGSWTLQNRVQQIDVSDMAAGHYLMSVAGADGHTFSGSLVLSK